MASNQEISSETFMDKKSENLWGSIGKADKGSQVTAQFVLGIICMHNKAQAKPMQEIIQRLCQNADLQVIIFDEDMILNQPIENWHSNIHVIIAFQSTGYPLYKVLSYVKKYKCKCINGDLINQAYFSNREKIKQILTKHDIPQPQYFAVHRQRIYCDNCKKRLLELKIKHTECLCRIKELNKIDNIDIPEICDQCKYISPEGLEIHDEYIQFQDKKISIPLLEKPINADNHDIYIYKPHQVIRLFRKQKNQSSQQHEGDFSPRQNGCFIYEEFLECQDNKDLKVYSIYPNYYLCELRKAPHIDGIVNRDPITGKEMRQQTSLTDIERKMAMRICVIFSQLICGFDILRTTDGRSLVMDINGFSFVKENTHYYDQTANIIRKMVVQEISKYNYFKHQIILDGQLSTQSSELQRVFQKSTNGLQSLSSFYLDELMRLSKFNYQSYKNNNYIEQKGLVSIMSAADLAPKFKYKFTSSSDILFDFFFEENNSQAEYKIRPQYSHERSIQIAQFMNKILKNNLYTFDHDPSKNAQATSNVQNPKQKSHVSQGPQDHNYKAKENTHSNSLLSVDINIDKAKVIQTSSYDSSKSEEIINQNLHKVQSNKTLVSMDNTYMLINEIHTHLENESLSIDQQVWQLNQQEMEGVKLMYHLISKNIPGVKIQVRPTGKDKEAVYIIKWGGYLTAAGARQAFLQGQKYKQDYNEEELNQNIKIFHSNERRIEKTAKMLILGYIAKHGTKLEQLLPEIANLQSDSNIPDPLEILEAKYKNEIVPQLGKTISQIKSKITIDDEVLTLNSKTAKRILAENQHELNKYMQSTKGYLGGDDMYQANKMFTAFKQWFDPVLVKVKRIDDKIATHFDALKLIGEKLRMLYQDFENLQSLFKFQEELHHHPNAQQSSESNICNFMYLDYNFFLKSFKYLVNQYIVLNPEFQFDISKIHDINTFLSYLIIHHKPLLKEHEHIWNLTTKLYQMVSPYDEQFMIQLYGPTQLQQALLGEKISYNLLQTIQSDIDTVYNYFRQCDKNIAQKVAKQRKESLENENLNHYNASSMSLFGNLPNSSFNAYDNITPVSQAPEEQESKVVAFAALSSIREQALRQNQQEKEPVPQGTIVPKHEQDSAPEASQGKKAVHFYVTDKAHLYTLYNLLTKVQNNLKPYLLHNKQDIFDTMSSINFGYYEMRQRNYYTKLRSGKITEQDLNNIATLSEDKNYKDEYIEANNGNLVAPHRFIQINCSFGMTNDIFQPVPNNVLPIDEADTFFSLFPFSSICQYNSMIQKAQGAGQGKQKLVSVIGVYRHGDRCPKQKIKLKMTSSLFFDFVVNHFQLNPTDPTDISINLRQPEKLDNFCQQLKQFLTMHSNHISNPHQLKQIYDVIKPKPPVLKVEIKFPTPFIGVKECQIIAKYGGTLTPLGELQAQLCGKLLYQQLVQDLPTSEIESLKETFKNSVKAFTNDEQRVKDTAEQFLNTFCRLLNATRPELQEVDSLSVVEHRARRSMEQEKSLINAILALDTNLMSVGKNISSGQGRRDLAQTIRQFDASQLEQINNPYQKLCKLKSLLDDILQYYTQILQNEDFNAEEVTQIHLAVARFHSVYEAFLPDSSHYSGPDTKSGISTIINGNSTQNNTFSNDSRQQVTPQSNTAATEATSPEKIKFNVSKIPDVYDLLRYDALHPIIRSQTLTGLYKQAYEQAKTLARFIAPNEFGTNPRNREVITSLIARDLIKSIKKCIKKQEINLFFVSESHIIALINLFILRCDQHQNIDIDQVVDFMGHIILKVYQNEQASRYRIEVFVSPGSYQNPFKCEYGVPRIIMPTLVGDDYDLTLIEQLSKKVDEHCALKQETFDLGFNLITQ